MKKRPHRAQEMQEYVDLLGKDFTEFVNTEQDVELFNKMINIQYQTIGVPFYKCFRQVSEVLNIERRLTGKGPRVVVVNNQNAALN